MSRERKPVDSLEVAAARGVPRFYIVDEELRVTFSSEHVQDPPPELPAELRAAVVRLLATLDAAGETSAVIFSSAEDVVRVERLEAEGAGRHHAVFLERAAVRNSLQNAAGRFKLSARETDVLGGLLRGEGTNEIAVRLSVSPTTVQEHIRKIGRKTQVSRRSEIVARVLGLH